MASRWPCWEYLKTFIGRQALKLWRGLTNNNTLSCDFLPAIAAAPGASVLAGFLFVCFFPSHNLCIPIVTKTFFLRPETAVLYFITSNSNLQPAWFYVHLNLLYTAHHKCTPNLYLQNIFFPPRIIGHVVDINSHQSCWAPCRFSDPQFMGTGPLRVGLCSHIGKTVNCLFRVLCACESRGH